MVSLIQLPEELLEHIVRTLAEDSQVPIHGLDSLSRTCHLLRRVTLPALFHTISVNRNRNSFEFWDIIEGRAPWLSHVSTLTLPYHADEDFSSLTLDELGSFASALVNLKVLR